MVLLSPLSLYQAVIDSSPSGTYLVSPTPEATILAVNGSPNPNGADLCGEAGNTLCIALTRTDITDQVQSKLPGLKARAAKSRGFLKAIFRAGAPRAACGRKQRVNPFQGSPHV
jgi:hypothetical protein